MADDDTPKRRGRPPIAPGASSVNLHFRLSASDYEKACRLAQKNGTTVPAILRAAFKFATSRDKEGLDGPERRGLPVDDVRRRLV